MSTKFMKDSYEETFNNMGELLDRLKELEDVSTWIRDVALRDIQIHAIVPWEELPEEYRSKETMEPETVEDTMHNSGFYVTLPDGQAYCLREQGISSVQGRAGITGQAYRRLSKEKTAQHLNDGLSVTDIGKKCYIRNEGGKILSIHSDEYNPFNMYEAYATAQEWLALQYPDAKFVEATMNHDGVVSKFDFSAYNAELFNDVKELFKAEVVFPTLQISMGDSAKAAVTIAPEVYANGLKIPLGDPITNKHRGNDNPLEKFKKALLEVEGQFERKIMNLRTLADIEITYPLDCFMNMSAQVGLLKQYTKATKMSAEMFNIMSVFPAQEANQKMSALDVYIGMCEIISYVSNETRAKGADVEAGVAKATSMVARALKINWKGTDFPNLDTIKGGGK